MATVTSLREAIDFRNYQHLLPLVVLAAWAAGLFTAWLFVAQRRQDIHLAVRDRS